MEQRLAALFASVGNALDSTTYTYSDSDYLVRKALTEFLDGENALVASARKIQDSSGVVTSVLNYIVSTDFSVEDPAEWYRKAMRIVVEFSDFAFRNEMSEDAARYSALLPEGHPRALNSITLTASAQRSALAEWMAADPRLDEKASAQIQKLYSSSELDDLELEFEYLKAEAMVASGRIPEELLPLTAAFNLSTAQRSAISKFFEKFRRRDRKGRFAEEFGRLSLIFGDKKGGFFSKAPKIVGPGNGPDRAIVEFDGSDPRIPKGLYDVDATKGENVKAYLPTSAVKGLPKGREVVAKNDEQYAIGLDELLASKVETPLNWEKSGEAFKTKDGKFTAEPISNSDAEKAINLAREDGNELPVAGVGDGDAFDPKAEGGSFLVADAEGKNLGVAQDWAGIEEIAIANGAEVGKMDDPSGVDVSGMTLEQLEREMGNPVDPSIPGSLDRYNKITDEFYRRGGYSALRKKQAQEREGAKPTDVKDMTLEELEGEMGEPVGPSKPGSLERYNEVTDEFYKRGGYAELRKQQAQGGKTEEPDLDQDIPGGVDKSKLSPSMLGEGYNFSKEGENSWVQEGVGSNGESYSVSKAPNGKWVVSERSGSEGDNAKERDLQSFDTAEEAFDFANDQGTSPNEFDEAWVNELMSEGGPDLDQNVTGPKKKLDAADFSPKDLENAQKYIDSANQAIFNNDRAKLNDTISKAANDSNVSDEAYSALLKAKDARDARNYEVENALAGGSREDIEALLEDPEYSGWASRLEDALAVDLNQDAPTLSEKQSEPASGKQYAFLDEFLAERQLDPATEQAFKDALENKNLNKAQASSLIAIGRSADFRPGVDPSKPSERMLNSLQGYLSSKDLAPSEIKEALDSLQKDGSRDNVDALLNKLRRKKDKPVDLNQGFSGLTRQSDGSYAWEDDYNNVNVNNTSKGWEVEYTSPSMEDGVNDWYYKSFDSEDEALAFAEELLKQNQGDGGYGRAADDLFDRGGASADVDLDQDAKGTLTDTATDKQWDFLQSLLDGKKINNSELESAVRSALEDRKLTKGEVGAFIGQLRPLEDKPNVRREPSAKQIASIKRALLERDMTPEERKSMQDKLASGLSFDEASEMLNDLKKRDITPMGMINLLDALKSDQDIDSLRYLLEKPEYSKYRTDIKDTLRQLALDTEDPNLQEFIDAREDVDLNQGIDSRRIESVLEAINKEEVIEALNDGGFDFVENEENFDWTSPDGRVNIYIEDDFGDPMWVVRVDAREVARDLLVDKENLGNEIVSDLTEKTGPDLDQDASNVSREVKQTVMDSLDDDFVVELDLGGDNYIREGLDSYDWTSPDGRVKVSMESDGDTETETSSTTWFLEVDGEEIAEGSFGRGYKKLSDEIFDALGISVSLTDEEELNYRLKFAKGERDAELAKINRRSESASNIVARMTPEKRADYENIMQQQRDLVERVYNRRIEGIKSQYGDIDLDQDVSSNLNRAADYLDSMSDPANWTNWDSFPEYNSPDGRLTIRAEGDPEGNFLEVYLDGEGLDLDDDAREAILDLIESNNFSAGMGRVSDKEKKFAAEGIADIIRESIADAQDGPDLNQDVSSSVSRNDIVEKLAEDIDAIESLAINGKELKNYLEEFDRTRYASTALEMAAEVENMSNYVSDPELNQRLMDLSSRLNDEIVDRFGIADAARADGDEILDLDDVERSVQQNIEMFFETDVDKIVEALDSNDSYGDSRSGGAEVSISQEEDGTWTASVQYDRSDEQFTGEDRDEVIAQAAVAAADYNSDVIPSSYREVDDLAGQASQAQTPDEASELADRMDALADAMSENRGDRDLAGNLRAYGERIRDMIEKRDRQKQSEVESNPLNSETMDEMATDPDLNPAGYADYIGNQVFELVGGKQSDVTSANNFISSDGRVELVVEKDGEYTVIVDGEEVFSGERTSDRWEFVAGVEKAIEDHFSKKD